MKYASASQTPLHRCRVAVATLLIPLLLITVVPSVYAQREITEDLVIVRDTILVEAFLHAGVTLTISSGVKVTFERDFAYYGFSTLGGTLLIQPGAEIILDTDRIHIGSEGDWTGYIQATGATFRRTGEANHPMIIIDDAFAEITDCTLDGVSIGTENNLISGPASQEHEYDIEIVGNQITTYSSRWGAMGLGAGRHLVKGNHISWEPNQAAGRNEAVVIVASGTVEFVNNDVELAGAIGGHAIHVSVVDSTNVDIVLRNNRLTDTRLGSFSAGIAMHTCVDDNAPVIIEGNTIERFASPLGVSGCNAVVRNNDMDGQERQGSEPVVGLAFGGEFSENTIRNYSVDASANQVSSNRGRILFVSGTMPLTIRGNLFMDNGLSATAPTDFYFSLVHVEGAGDFVGNTFRNNRLTSARYNYYEPSVVSLARNMQHAGSLNVQSNVFQGNTFRGNARHDSTGAKGSLLHMYFVFPLESFDISNNYFDGGDQSVAGLHMTGSRNYVNVSVRENTFANNHVGAFTAGVPDFTGGNIFRNSARYHLQRARLESTSDTLLARSNDWGTINPLEIDQMIYDDEEANNVNVGPVDFGDSRHEQFAVTLDPVGPLELVAGGSFPVTAIVRDLAGNPRVAPVQFTRETMVGDNIVVLEPWATFSNESGRGTTTAFALNVGTVQLRASVDGKTSNPLEIVVLEDKTLVLRDANNDVISDVEFEFFRVQNNPPQFTEELLGSIVTDAEGSYRMNAIGVDSFLIASSALNPVSDTVQIGDWLRLSRHVLRIDAKKHLSVLPTRHKANLDNAKFDATGYMSYDALDATARQDIVLNHSEFRYDLFVSVEWDADLAYLQSLEEAFRSMSTYLYDVTDGQARLDTVLINDDRRGWSEADIRVFASNYHRPRAPKGGIEESKLHYSVEMPRKWYRTEGRGRIMSQQEQSSTGGLDLNVVANFRAYVHELGHYVFGFGDEYKFYDPDQKGYYALSKLRCARSLLEDLNYGFMDQTITPIGGWATEMSSVFRYQEESCRNTEQYHRRGRSCWDYLEFSMEGFYPFAGFGKTSAGQPGLWIPVIKPNDPERELASGSDYLPGPNNVDVGSKVVFPFTHDEPDAQTIHLQVLGRDGTPVKAAKVDLQSRFQFPATYTLINQGRASDDGRIFVLGFLPGDDVEYQGWRLKLVDGKRSAASEREWVSGQATLNSSNDLVLYASAVAGDYPLIVLTEFEPDGTPTYGLSYASPFSDHPSVRLYSGESTETYSLTDVAGNYAASITDSVGTEGSLTLIAVDDSAKSFLATMPYVVSYMDNPEEPRVIGPENLVELHPGYEPSSVEKILVLASSYPVRRNGLDSEELQAGRAYSVAVHPASSIETGYALSIMYDDEDLQFSDGTMAADESMLRVFRWEEVTERWDYVGGNVDTAYNWVEALIPGNGVYAAFTTTRGVGLEEATGTIAPDHFDLMPNYPNPFVATTSISYTVPTPSWVTLTVYDVLGREISRLADAEHPPGVFHRVFDASTLASGVYFYRIVAGDYTHTKSLVVVK